MSNIVLYRFPVSGHAHRVELLCSLLKLPAKLVDVNLAAGEQKKPEFLSKNPFGQVPVMEDDGVTIADEIANAITENKRPITDVGILFPFVTVADA